MRFGHKQSQSLKFIYLLLAHCLLATRTISSKASRGHKIIGEGREGTVFDGKTIPSILPVKRFRGITSQATCVR